jgi:nucleotide-binding universal stress UspA family protein
LAAIERILVPLDLNRLSEAKVPVAEAQARAFDAEIILLHVVPPDRSGEEISSHEAQARTYLDAITARLRSEGIKVSPLLRSGPPAETILEEIDAQRADLVILGSDVRRGLSRLLLGSVAEEIIAKAPCPVLLIRPIKGEEPSPPAVRSFTEDAASAGPVAPRSLGIRTVEVARIIGSVGRANELDENFRSVSHRRAEEMRYQRVLTAMERGVGLPPVVLYKLGYGYYVLDGNHRVAAAKRLGQLEIDATVTEFIPVSDPQAQRVFSERRAFEQATGLTRIGAALPGHYPRIVEMICAYASVHDQEDLKEAARRWETEVYRPAAQRIRALRLTRQFAGERTADVFVRLADWREEQAKGTGILPDWDEAIDKYADGTGTASPSPTDPDRAPVASDVDATAP